MKKKTDWVKIKSENVTNDGVTLKDLAERYGVSFSYLQRKSAKDGWTASRVKYRSLVEGKIEEELATDAASERAAQIKVGKTLLAVGLSAIFGDNPRFKPKNFKEAVSTVKMGAGIVSKNLPKNDENLKTDEIQKTLRDLRKAMQEELPNDSK